MGKSETEKVALFERLASLSTGVAGVCAELNGKLVDLQTQDTPQGHYVLRITDLTVQDVVRGVKAFTGVDLLDGSVGSVGVAGSAPQTLVQKINAAAGEKDPSKAVAEVLVAHGMDSDWIDEDEFKLKKPALKKLMAAESLADVAAVIVKVVGDAECMESVSDDASSSDDDDSSSASSGGDEFSISEDALKEIKKAKSSDDIANILIDSGAPIDADVLNKFLQELRDNDLAPALEGKKDAIIARRVGLVVNKRS